MERAVFERMAEIDGEHWWFAGRRRIVRNVIRQQIRLPKNARIAEIGCGTGSNLALLQEFGRVDAIEPDSGARLVATSRSGIVVREGYLPNGINLNDESYDLIVLLDVLEHVADDGAALAALRRKLKPGGKLLLTVPALQWLWSAHDEAHHHHRRYTGGELSALLEQKGFVLRHESYFNTLLFPLIVLARLIGRARGQKDGDDAMPSGLVNKVLGALFGIEASWVGRFKFPIGVSLIAVAEPR